MSDRDVTGGVGSLDALRGTFAKAMLVLLWGMLALVTGVAAVQSKPAIAVFVIGLILAGLSTLSWRAEPIGLNTRVLTSVSLMGLVALLVYAMGGSHLQIDMHMAFFAALAIVAAWCCPVAILAATGIVAVHHLLLNALMPFAIWPDGSEFGRVVIHAVILVSQAVALVWMTQFLGKALAASDAAADRARSAEREARATSDEVAALAAEQETRRKQVDEAVGAFRGNVETLLDNVARSIGALRSAHDTLVEASTDTNGQAEQARISAAQSEESVGTVSSATEELDSSIREIGGQLNSAADTVQTLAAEARQADERVGSLATAVEQIGSVVSLIQAIAEQTNLLALNATIEAARAGDAGRGFAVVASEVKSLATQTAKATEEISGQIVAIQSSTSGAVEAIRHITARMDDVTTYTTNASGAVEQQGAATSEISRNVSLVQSGVAGVASVVDRVREAADRTGEAADAVTRASSEVDQAADTLKAEIDGFLDRVARTA